MAIQEHRRNVLGLSRKGSAGLGSGAKGPASRLGHEIMSDNATIGGVGVGRRRSTARRVHRERRGGKTKSSFRSRWALSSAFYRDSIKSKVAPLGLGASLLSDPTRR